MEEAHNEITKFEQELRAECVADIVIPNSFTALFSPPESFQLFYLLHALSIETLSEMMIDQYNHVIQQGDKYILCTLLEKLKEKHGHTYQKNLYKTAFVFPAQVLCPLKILDESLSMSAADYQWLVAFYSRFLHK